MKRARPAGAGSGVGLALQGVVALALTALLVAGSLSVLHDLQARGLTPGLGFLRYQAGFGISEGPAFATTDSVGRAFLVGLANTLRVAAVGIVAATALGLVVALGRLSGNPLASRLCAAYVDVLRNTPVVLQLIFWYRGVVLRLPALGDAFAVGPRGGAALAFLSQRGLAVPRATGGPGALGTALVLVVGAVAAAAVARWQRRRAERGQTAHPWLAAGAAFVLVVGVGWALAAGTAVRLTLPTRSRFRYENGLVLTPEYIALVVGLAAYTAAFIAEVIRSGIESVPKGQREAGLALGLRSAPLMSLVILPQALRVIVPPLTSQYLNLTKNSSLAIAIGYPDMFNVGRTILNQTGQAVTMIALMMAVYLTISLATSLAMNLYNRRVRLVER